MRRPPKLLCYLLCCLQPLWVMSCSNDSIGSSGTGASSTLAGILANTNLGEVVFQIYRQRVELEPAGAERDARLAELDARHVPFVDAINRIVNQGTLPPAGISQMVQALYGLVDDGTLPTLTNQMADALERLERDPAALDALVGLLGAGNGPSAASLDALVQLIGRLLNHPESADVILALARVVEEADQSPATIEFLIPLLTALPGFLPNLFCAGISQDLASLDALARSGALDALLPLAKVFKDRGQVPLLIRLLGRVQADYDALLRPVEENVAAQLESGAYEALFEAIDLARGVTDPLTGQRTSEVLVDLVGALIDDDVTINDRGGNRVASRLHLLIGPLRDLDARLQAAGSGPLLDRLGGDLFDVMLERVTVGGQERLRNGNLVPLLAEVTDVFSQALPTDATQRRTEISAAQTELTDALSGRGFAQVLALLRTIDLSPSRAALNRAMVSLLTPQQQLANDAFGELARLAVMGLQNPPQGTVSGLQPLSSFAASLIDPSQTLVQQTFRAMERLLTADGGQTLLGIGRAATGAPPGGGQAPILVLVRVFRAILGAGSPAPYDRASLAADLRWAVDLIRDDVDGLGWIFQLIRDRQI